MAYAELAGVPAVMGLYTTITSVLAYALFGPSRVLLLGPDSSLAPLIAAAIALAGMLALMTGGSLQRLPGQRKHESDDHCPRQRRQHPVGRRGECGAGRCAARSRRRPG